MKINKGENGYISSNRKKSAIMASVLLSCIFIASVIGRIFLTKYLLYFAISSAVLIIPAGKSITQFVLFSKYKAGSTEAYQKLQAISENLLVLCDLIMVKDKKTVFLGFAVVTDVDILVCYQPNAKKQVKNELKVDQAIQVLHEIIKPKGFAYRLEMFDSEEKMGAYIKKNIKVKLKDIDVQKQNKLATILLQSAV